ncbi:hypothetical protein N7527_000126 [Penicillium freii]|nr:hypothetical protein N7527_000126 [Penicillium freii]
MSKLISLYRLISLAIVLALSNGYHRSTHLTEFIIDLGSYTAAKALPISTTPGATSKPCVNSMRIRPHNRLIRSGNYAEKEQRCIVADPQTKEGAAE